jgi:crotonobetainyl-CoA:carnitine CoA-transferase CaiB-like acyl-CoA transferase
MREASLPGALGPIAAIDFSDTVAGQFCARLLADFGAQVFLVEPEDGSPIRRRPPFSRDGLSLAFHHLNTGKRSLRFDRRSPRGRDRLFGLAAGADVVILPPGEDAAPFAAANEAAIVVSLSAFGADGPLSAWRGPEIVLQALSGIMYNNGEAGREPLYGVGDRASYAAGLAAYIGVLTALYERHGSGRGQTVTVDSAETAAAMCFPYVVQHIYNGTVRSRSDRTIPAGQVLCRDGWVCIWIYDHRWKAVLDVLGLSELEHDPRFSEPRVRRENWDALFEIIQEKVAGLSAEDLVEALQQAQVIAAKSYRPSEQFENRHLKARNYWEEAGGRTILGPPFRLSRTPRRISAGAPDLGEASGEAFPVSLPRVPAAGAAGSGRPLEGIRVIELTTAWAGPMAGRVLAFFGAQSIHVEAPNRVNSWRLNKEMPNPVNFPGGVPGERPFDRAFLFNSQNVNKLSCILDLKREEGRTVLRRLVAVSDVLICNFRPGTLKKLGLDYEALKAIKPDIIVAELPAFGTSGPMSGYAALGPTMEMATGMSAMIGYRGGKPETTGPSYLDPIGGFNAASAILTALVHRQRTGEGQHIEVPQVEAAMQFIGPELLSAVETGEDPGLRGNRVLHAAPHDAYRAAGEDEWVAIAAEDDGQFRALCAAMARPDLADDPRFSTLAARLGNIDALDAEIEAWTSLRNKHEIAAMLQSAGVAAAPVQNPKDLAESAYLAHRSFFTELEHPDAGRHRYPGLPFRLGRTPGGQWRAAPTFGGDNDAVLEEILGLPPEEVAAIRESGAMSTLPLPGG